jgi:ribonuclease Z
MFGVTILGNNSAIPAYDRHPTAQVVTLNEQVFLIDCGEGTQMQLTRYKVKRNKMHHIFISHMHGDHYFGLIGLLTSMGLLGREQPLNLYGPPELMEIIKLQLKAADTELPYPLEFHPLIEEGTIVDAEKFSVETFKVFHRIPCFGFIIREKKRARKIDRDKAIANDIPANFFEQLKDGEDYIKKDGSVVKNESVTTPNTSGKSYAFCGDTVFNEQIAERIKNVTVAYHETTYLKAHADKAVARFHCTTEHAGRTAKQACVETLLIGHFSSKYEKLDEFLSETKEFFENTYLAIEGVTYRI